MNHIKNKAYLDRIWFEQVQRPIDAYRRKFLDKSPMGVVGGIRWLRSLHTVNGLLLFSPLLESPVQVANRSRRLHSCGFCISSPRLFNQFSTSACRVDVQHHHSIPPALMEFLHLPGGTRPVCITFGSLWQVEHYQWTDMPDPEWGITVVGILLEALLR